MYILIARTTLRLRLLVTTDKIRLAVEATMNEAR